MGSSAGKETMTAKYAGASATIIAQNATDQSGQMDKNSTTSMKQKHLFPPQYNEKLKFIQGYILYVHLCDVDCENTTGALFNVNHAYVIFVFTSGEAIRCEIGTHKNGATIIIYQVDTYKADNDEKFDCLYKLNMNDLIDKCTKFYEKGDFHIQFRNCYDFAEFMINDWFKGADKVALKWKEQQVKKVPNALKS